LGDLACFRGGGYSGVVNDSSRDLALEHFVNRRKHSHVRHARSIEIAPIVTLAGVDTRPVSMASAFFSAKAPFPSKGHGRQALDY
jgi:hypothetical protein